LDGETWTGSIWLRIGTGGGLLWIQFHYLSCILLTQFHGARFSWHIGIMQFTMTRCVLALSVSEYWYSLMRAADSGQNI
jgi:hypothetical protein